MQRRALLALLALVGACGGGATGQADHDDDPAGDNDCVMDACGVCDGDGSTCVPQATIVFVLQVEGATLGVFPFGRGVGSASSLVSTSSTVLPGKLLYTDVSLTRALTDSLELASWRAAIEDGAMSTQMATLMLSDTALGSTIARWQLTDAWPRAIAVASDADGLNETVVLTHAGLRRVAP